MGRGRPVPARPRRSGTDPGLGLGWQPLLQGTPMGPVSWRPHQVDSKAGHCWETRHEGCHRAVSRPTGTPVPGTEGGLQPAASEGPGRRQPPLGCPASDPTPRDAVPTGGRRDHQASGPARAMRQEGVFHPPSVGYSPHSNIAGAD